GFVRAGRGRAVEMDNVACTVFVRMDARRDAVLCQHGIGTAACHRVDRLFDVRESPNCAERESVVHRDREVASVGADAVATCARAGVHSGTGWHDGYGRCGRDVWPPASAPSLSSRAFSVSVSGAPSPSSAMISTKTLPATTPSAPAATISRA